MGRRSQKWRSVATIFERCKYIVYDGGNVVLDLVDADAYATGNAPTLDKRYFQGPGVDQLLTQERFANYVLLIYAESAR